MGPGFVRYSAQIIWMLILSTDERERRQIARERKGELQNVVLNFFAAFSCVSRVHMYHELRRCISTTRGLVSSCPIFVLII
jgi:hypothetical protein